MLNGNLTLDDFGELLTVEQTANYLGVCKNTIYSLCKKKPGGLPSFKSGNTRHIRKATLVRWIEQQESEVS